MTTINQLCDEGYILMRQLCDAEDKAVNEGRDSDAVRLDKVYFKANRRWWRRYNQLRRTNATK